MGELRLQKLPYTGKSKEFFSAHHGPRRLYLPGLGQTRTMERQLASPPHTTISRLIPEAELAA